MGAFDSADGQSQNPAAELIEKMEWHDLDVQKALPADLQTAIKDALAWMKKPEGDAPKDAISRVADFLGKVAGGKYPYPSPQGKSEKDEKAQKAAAEKATCPECGATMKAGVCPECGFKAGSKTKAEKAAEDKAKEDEKNKGVAKSEDMTIRISPSGEVTLSGQPIEKGRKTFTDDRTKTFGATVKNLMTMLAEVDAPFAKSIIDELAKSLLPANVQWTSGTTPTAASVQKELTEMVATVLAPVAKKIEDLGVKVEEITKSRQAPNSEGDNSTQKVQKSDNGFWKGLPLR